MFIEKNVSWVLTKMLYTGLWDIYIWFNFQSKESMLLAYS